MNEKEKSKLQYKKIYKFIFRSNFAINYMKKKFLLNLITQDDH